MCFDFNFMVKKMLKNSLILLIFIHDFSNKISSQKESEKH